MPRAVVAKKPVAKRAVAAAPKKPGIAKPVAVKQVSRPIKAKAAPRALKPAVKAAEKPAVPPKEKAKEIKLVRDSFSMPEAEYAVLGTVKKACLKAGIEVKKSELLRIGVALIKKIDLAALKRELTALQPLKAGRPKKEK